MEELQDLINGGENLKVEFKSWIETPNFKSLIKLCVKEVVALANSDGGYLLLGVEDDGTITGCEKYDLQNIIESIYDRTVPKLFTRVESQKIEDKDVIIITNFQKKR